MIRTFLLLVLVVVVAIRADRFLSWFWSLFVRKVWPRIWDVIAPKPGGKLWALWMKAKTILPA